MAYQKILVDNLTCKRRFHISFDDEQEKEQNVEIRCLHCNAVIFKKESHPPVKLLRDENLIKLTDLSPLRTKECHFKDPLAPKASHAQG